MSRGKMASIVDQLMRIPDCAYIDRLAFLFEDSPWVEPVAARRPFADLHAGLMQVVANATQEERLALIRNWRARRRSTAR